MTAIIPNSTTNHEANRDSSAMVYDTSRTQLFFYGGKNNSTVFKHTWAQVNAGSWLQKSPATSPIPVYQHALAYYGTDGYTYLHGGADTTTFYNSMYKWDGLTWTKLAPAGTLPSQRFAHEMVADGYGHLVMFGGIGTDLINRQNYLQDTFQYSAGAWTKITSTNVPPARAYHSLTYNGSTVILYGGECRGQYLTDMWSINNTNQWSLIAQVGTLPMARKGAAVVYDSHNNLLFMFGGLCVDGHVSNQTYTYSFGTNTWTLVSTPTHPTRRYNTAIAFDSGTNTIVMFGGRGDGVGSYQDTLGDVWTYDCVANTWSGVGDFEAAQSTGPVF